jgi:hypothetical protein
MEIVMNIRPTPAGRFSARYRSVLASFGAGLMFLCAGFDFGVAPASAQTETPICAPGRRYEKCTAASAIACHSQVKVDDCACAGDSAHLGALDTKKGIYSEICKCTKGAYQSTPPYCTPCAETLDAKTGKLTVGYQNQETGACSYKAYSCPKGQQVVVAGKDLAEYGDKGFYAPPKTSCSSVCKGGMVYNKTAALWADPKECKCPSNYKNVSGQCVKVTGPALAKVCPPGLHRNPSGTGCVPNLDMGDFPSPGSLPGRTGPAGLPAGAGGSRGGGKI